ncbi:MAG: hypothetical protein HKN74_14085 [Acidimicrobiia bacterium]|nr:hypothetical protein [Acidimicrobiia bacterium]MBT8217232.1 hypothetical protein [Acidimicrobiia bacterium]NNF11403.1 hypothetical protein [Acidimicrobiia bacterium]NNL70333.1 hypothetical protein [Acidimicrobiia bacterium]
MADGNGTGVPTGPASGLRRDGTAGIVGGSLVAALAAYAFLQGAARLLGADRFAAISALWTIQFLAMAVALLPLEQMVIRDRSLRSGRGTTAAIAVTAAATLIATGYAYLNVDTLFAGESVYVLLTGVGVVAMAGFALARGELAGRLRYRDYGLVTGGQAVLRLVAGLGLIALTDSAVGGGWAIVLSPLVVLLWWPRRSEKNASGERDRPGAFLTGFLLANGAAQVILVAGPLAVERLGGAPAAVSVLFVTLTLFRAPLAVANNVLARLLPPFAAMAADGLHHRLRLWSRRLAGLAGAAAALALGLGAWLGPGLTAVLFGSDFRPAAATAAFIAAGSVLATGSSFANQILVALGATWRLAAAWLIGLAAAVVVLAAVDGEPAPRVAAAFLAGEAAALVGITAQVHLNVRRTAGLSG